MTESSLSDLLARVVTLSQASTLCDHPSAYFRVRRARYAQHADDRLRFPDPVRSGGRDGDEFDLWELQKWDQRRLLATPAGRAVLKREKETTT